MESPITPPIDKTQLIHKVVIGIGAFSLGILVPVLASTVFYSLTVKPTKVQDAPSITGAAEFNCKLSSGTWTNGSCSCPSKELADDGFCIDPIGSPSGDAWRAVAGLPYGDFLHYETIVKNWCEYDGGTLASDFTCSCPEKTVWNKTDGRCHTNEPSDAILSFVHSAGLDVNLRNAEILPERPEDLWFGYTTDQMYKILKDRDCASLPWLSNKQCEVFDGEDTLAFITYGRVNGEYGPWFNTGITVFTSMSATEYAISFLHIEDRIRKLSDNIMKSSNHDGVDLGSPEYTIYYNQLSEAIDNYTTSSDENIVNARSVLRQVAEIIINE